MSSSPALSERIALLMVRLGLKSRAALAERLGYSRTQLHAIETGKLDPTDRFLEKLEELERMCGLSSRSEQIEQSARDLPRPTVARSDAEIAALTALLNEHAAMVNAGVRKGDLPLVRQALEAALKDRGILPRKSE